MALADRAAQAVANAQAERPAIVAYKGEVLLHTFMTRPTKKADGTFTKREPTGDVAYVYRILPTHADGSTTTSGAIWLWLEQARPKADAPKLDPALLRAFRDSLVPLANDIDATEADAVESGDWKPRTSAKVEAPAPKLKGIAARAAKETAEADGAKAVDLDASMADLPF